MLPRSFRLRRSQSGIRLRPGAADCRQSAREKGGVPMTVIKSSRIRGTLLACAFGSMLPALCLAQMAQTAGMPPLPPLKGTGQLGAAADPVHFSFVMAGDNRPATETAPPPPPIQSVG